MKPLTRAEEQIMQALWKLQEAFVKEIIAELPPPKPHYNTVSTLVKILVEKGFVDYKAFGKSHRYYPLVSKSDYSKRTLRHFVKGYFEGSFSNMVSFFAKEKDISIHELESLLEEIKKSKTGKS
ncbi:BlaI/MecI/CopY family transcriptional regulator [Compostibacter hankyongensis]|uniref:BlaI/MecI/CopY family transcriptional regulator n=1 Tax=Compostibacter hankyongensis TaxID=1007089 RepID=A0ABP8G901_9BACT